MPNFVFKLFKAVLEANLVGGLAYYVTAPSQAFPIIRQPTTTSQFSAAPPCRHRGRCSIGGFSQQKTLLPKNPKSQERGCLPPIEPSSERPEFKKSNNEEAAVLSASRAASTVVYATNATEVFSFLSDDLLWSTNHLLRRENVHHTQPTDPEYAPPVVKGETPGQRRARIHRLRTNFEFITLTLSLWLTFVHFDDRDLSYNFFNGSIPESLGGLTSLRILNLNGNSL
ncbi:unnamed protein product [Lactuca virosa]|uniref:Uncharacterized protein n=1 Tax=Lactuca virosa TaxID=75947 RepID=A0AAU9N180_9ASTR|nr:unnamed protein product [Lactuca virosa]